MTQHSLCELHNLRLNFWTFDFFQGQIKSKETALETSTAAFLEKEKDLQNIIEELESRVEEINQNSAFQMVSKPSILRNASDTVLKFDYDGYKKKLCI